MTKKEWIENSEVKDLPFMLHEKCTSYCDGGIPEIRIHGYASDTAVLELCLSCATQLARKLLEDLSVYTPGGRHG